jgi:hypothetical protein
MTRSGGSAFAVVLALGLAGVAQAQPAAVTVDWAEKPARAEELAALAKVRARPARAAARCTPGVDGRLQACRTVLESPKRSGAAQALETLIPLYRLSSGAATPEMLGGDVIVSVSTFEVDVPPAWPDEDGEFAIRWPPGSQAKAGGEVLLDCVAGRTGALYDCQVLAETPADLGFGWKALRLTPFMRLTPARRDGKATQSSVTFPLRFPAVR